MSENKENIDMEDIFSARSVEKAVRDMMSQAREDLKKRYLSGEKRGVHADEVRRMLTKKKRFFKKGELK